MTTSPPCKYSPLGYIFNRGGMNMYPRGGFIFMWGEKQFIIEKTIEMSAWQFVTIYWGVTNSHTHPVKNTCPPRYKFNPPGTCFHLDPSNFILRQNFARSKRILSRPMLNAISTAFQRRQQVQKR